ncbi:MAG: ribosome biogenesis GTPase A [Saprospiraceae bacterium]|jgi:ribosome biogenesis GTPase A
MNIQWFPGHMHKAIKEIKETLNKVDMFIEVLDARIPYSSQNPVLEQVRGDKPGLKVLTKADLADPKMTKLWLAHISENEKIASRAITMHRKGEVKKLTGVCRGLFSHKLDRLEPIRVMIVGIPNVGKSSLINALSGKTIAKTGNEPAVTKRQQRIELENNILLLDTPGVLWPNIENRYSGLRLGVTGAIKDTAVHYDTLAYYAAELMLDLYPERLAERYKLDTMPEDNHGLIQAIAAYRGAIKTGGKIDIERTCNIFIKDIRSGVLGGLTLENPDVISLELAEMNAKKEDKEAQKLAKKAERKKRYLRNRK